MDVVNAEYAGTFFGPGICALAIIGDRKPTVFHSGGSVVRACYANDLTKSAVPRLMAGKEGKYLAEKVIMQPALLGSETVV